MSNYKNENSKRENNNEDNNDEHEKMLYRERQEIENAYSHLSDTTIKVTNTMNEYQQNK